MNSGNYMEQKKKKRQKQNKTKKETINPHSCWIGMHLAHTLWESLLVFGK